jgi:hypothetical protein
MRDAEGVVVALCDLGFELARHHRLPESGNLRFQRDFTSNMSAHLDEQDPLPNRDMMARQFATGSGRHEELRSNS